MLPTWISGNANLPIRPPPPTPPVLSDGAGLRHTSVLRFGNIAQIVVVSLSPPKHGRQMFPTQEPSKEYLNAIDYRAFVKTINGRYNSDTNPGIDRERQKVLPPSQPLACGAPTQARLDFDECRRLLRMRFEEPECPVPFSGRGQLLERKGILELLSCPHYLAVILGVDRLFLWDRGFYDSVNFVEALLGRLSWHGYR